MRLMTIRKLQWRLFGESGKLVILVNLRIEGDF